VSTGNVLVPDVVGKTKAEATTLLNAAKLQVNTSPVESPNTPDTVVTQDVPADTPVKQGRVINLTIATAPTTATIPDGLAGKTYDQVVQQLKTVVTIESIDPDGQFVIYRTEDGLKAMRTVADKKLLQGVRQGDRVEITLTRERAVSIQRAR